MAARLLKKSLRDAGLPALIFFGLHLEMLATSSFTRERNNFNMGEGFALRYLIDRSIFGPLPSSGRVVSASGRNVFA